MSAFTTEEKRRFRMKHYLKTKAFEYLAQLIKNLALTELVVYATDSGKYLTGLVMALGFTVGWGIYDIINFKRDRLDIELPKEQDGKSGR